MSMELVWQICTVLLFTAVWLYVVSVKDID